MQFEIKYRFTYDNAFVQDITIVAHKIRGTQAWAVEAMSEMDKDWDEVSIHTITQLS